MIEPAFYALAGRAMAAARKESKERTDKALRESKQPSSSPSSSSDPSSSSATHPHVEDDTPVATASQLVGPECVRFQGLRVAYFTVDKDAKLACLEEGGPEGAREGDRIVLNRIVSLKEDSGKGK